MRLIYVTSSFPFGPGEAFVMPELAALENQGHDVLVVPLWPRGGLLHTDAARFLANTVSARLFSAGIARDCAVAGAKPASTICRVARSFSRSSSTLLLKDHVVLPKAIWLARLASLWKADHIHAFWASGPASLALAASEICRIPWSFTAHRFDIVGNKLLRYKAEHARFVRFISESGFRMSGLAGTRLEKKLTVLHLGVEVRKGLPIVSSPDAPVIALCAASLIPVKDHLDLLKAMEILHSRGLDLKLYLAGDGELRKRLHEEVQQRALGDRVYFLGSVAHSALMDLYASGIISTIVLASADLGRGLCEGIPVSLMEAMSFGIPVVATKTGGISELLEGGAGWMVPEQNPRALADALHLLIQNPRLRQTLGRAGQERVRSEFSAPQIARRLGELFSAPVETFSMQL
jgi:colanic acid/amylovoran biosynthesis glycosyltransferase